MKIRLTYHYDASYEQIPYQVRSEYKGEAVWTGGKSWEEAKAENMKRLKRLSESPKVPEPEEVEI